MLTCWTHSGAVQQVQFKLKVGGGGVEQPAAVQLALQVRLRLVFQHSPSGIQKCLLQIRQQLNPVSCSLKTIGCSLKTIYLCRHKESYLTCCPRFIAKQEQETPNWNRKTMKRITMYWGAKLRKVQKHGKCNYISKSVTFNCIWPRIRIQRRAGLGGGVSLRWVQR